MPKTEHTQVSPESLFLEQQHLVRRMSSKSSINHFSTFLGAIRRSTFGSSLSTSGRLSTQNNGVVLKVIFCLRQKSYALCLISFIHFPACIQRCWFSFDRECYDGKTALLSTQLDDIVSRTKIISWMIMGQLLLSLGLRRL